MTYSPTDQLHRHFRFPQVLRYSLRFDSDSIGTPVMFTDSVDKATNKTPDPTWTSSGWNAGVHSARLVHPFILFGSVIFWAISMIACLKPLLCEVFMNLLVSYTGYAFAFNEAAIHKCIAGDFPLTRVKEGRNVLRRTLLTARCRLRNSNINRFHFGTQAT
jgi:hypothetical protein